MSAVAGGAPLVRCTGLVADLETDCHAEGDDWAELRMVSALLDAHTQPDLAPPPKARRLGIATGAARVVAPDDTVEAVGGEPFRLSR